MSRVRAFRLDDIEAVGRLWMQVFGRQRAPATAGLRDYFREIFFANPWVDPGLPSLVHENDRGEVSGFLGVIPRRMRYRGRPVRVAVATQLMVDEARSPAYAAASLLRRFLAGPQDLSLSDGANEAGEKLWRACGGEAAMLHSMVWQRILRPARHLQLRLRERSQAGAGAAAWLGPLAGVADALLVHGGCRYWQPTPLPASPRLEVEEAPDAARLLECIRALGARCELRPDYDMESLRWLLRQAAAKRKHGALCRMVLSLPGGAPAGWFLCYLRPGGMAQVLQCAARPGLFGAVFDMMARKAWSEGAAGLSGGLDPRLARELVQRRCRLLLPGYGVLVHSRDAGIRDAVHSGNAFLTRLEGEWWARFSDPDWCRSAAEPAGARRPAPLGQAPQLKVASY